MYSYAKSSFFKAVIFDMDGIIFDSERIILDCWKIIANRYKIPDIETTYMSCIGINSINAKHTMLNHYGNSFDFDTYQAEVSSIFHSKYGSGCLPMKPGVIEILSALKEHQIPIALASSTKQDVVIKELSAAGIISYFCKIICGDMIQNSKPAPDIFLKACEELQMPPQDIYAIEDSYNGIRSAHAAGLHPIMVPDLAKPTKEIEQMAEVILPTLLEVKNYLFPN